jgi:hypothetical protein
LIVFIHLPRGVGHRAFAAFRKALGEEAVGWLGRSVTAEDMGPALAERGLRVLGGPIRLKAADALDGVSLFTTVIDDPRLRTLRAWRNAQDDPDDPHHAMAHTLSLPELIEEKHPLVAPFANALTRHFTPPGHRVTAANAFAAMKARPFLVGDAAQPKAYAEALAAELGLAPDALDHRVFNGLGGKIPPGEVKAALARHHAMDLRLVDRIAKERPRDSSLVRTLPSTTGADG